MTEDWNTTPQESLLDTIYESVVGSVAPETWVPDIYGVTKDRPVARLYIKDPDGNCWEIIAKPHPHRQPQED